MVCSHYPTHHHRLQCIDGDLPLRRVQQEWKCWLLDYLHQEFPDFRIRPLYISHYFKMESVLHGVSTPDASILPLPFHHAQRMADVAHLQELRHLHRCRHDDFLLHLFCYFFQKNLQGNRAIESNR